MPFVEPLTRFARTAESAADIPGALDEAFAAAAGPPVGADLRRLPARPRVHGVRRGRRSPAGAARPPRAARRRRRRAGDRAAQGRRAPRDHGRHRPLLRPRRGRAEGARRGAADPRLRERPGPGVHPGRPRAGLLTHARQGPQGGRRRAGGGGADGLPPGLRRLVRRRHPDRADRLGAARAQAAARAGAGAVRRYPRDARRAAQARAGRTARRGSLPARDRGREARRRAGGSERRPRAAAPAAPLQRAAPGARPRRRDRGRRRRLRLLRRPGDRLLRAGLLDGPGPLRLPRRRTGLRARGQAGQPGQAGVPAAGRRRLRLPGHGVRHAGAPRRARGGRDGQQRHLGAGEAPDGVPLRLLGRGRAPAGLPLRPGGRGAGRPRRARGDARPS